MSSMIYTTMSAVSGIFKLCAPASIYLVLSMVVLVLGIFSGISALTLIFKSALIVVWTFLLNWLCSRGFAILAWLILLLPVLLILLLASWSNDVVSKSRVVPACGGCASCSSSLRMVEGMTPAPAPASAKAPPPASSNSYKNALINST